MNRRTFEEVLDRLSKLESDVKICKTILEDLRDAFIAAGSQEMSKQNSSEKTLQDARNSI